MGYYNVIRPCVVGNLHYVRPTPYFSPIEVDDEIAAPLVESGDLAEYLAVRKGSIVSELIANTAEPECIAPRLGHGFIEAFGAPVEVAADKPAPRTRSRRKASED
ncbi:hypothetical protein [Mycolicibacterium llatzerense]|uniref:hypothetical protein n=1 Tax=Mycolicibacterium llatzerense TaxID=280871 RepID=UPI0021B5999D|nr:hypothetical protein [Mycolicibacterium llatzerense]MCT7372937.1 hypothetical protein [Mycolicibacterium llatzerense]